ncbi:MAG: hypothetical protein ABIS09_00830 [Sphingomicrobium sp.]
MASLPLPIDAKWATSPAITVAEIVGVQEPARLSALEWSVVAMGEKDSLSSLREPGRFLTALGSVFGFRRANSLANDRLEAIRRIAILAWHYRWNVPKSEVQAFLEAGFTPDHYELVQTSIGQSRAARGRRAAR